MAEVTTPILWTKVELYGSNNDGGLRRYTVADGTQISKGILLSLADNRTAAAAVAATRVYAGVAAMDKVANDGATSISAWTDGIFEAQASLAITIGAPVTGGELNSVNICPTTGVNGASGAQVLGYALEAADANEVINVRLRL